MDKALIAATLKKVRDNSPKRNFKQGIDLIMNLKGLDLKKPEHQISLFVTLHYGTGKKISVCALVDADLAPKAKEVCDETILAEQFEKFKIKAAAKRLADKHDFFVAQSSIMPKVATVFGRYFGPRGKMPNPKIGSVLTPASNIKQLCDQLKKTVLLATKNEPTIKCRIGNEDTKDDDAIENVLSVYNSVAQKLPNEKQNIKNVMLKLTMGPSFIIGSKEGIESKPQGREKSKGREKGKKEAPKEQKSANDVKEDSANAEKKPESKPKSRKKGK